MDTDAHENESNMVILGSKSWTAFALPVISALTLCVILLPVLLPKFTFAGLILPVMALLFCLAKLAELRSVILYQDGEGVWLQTGFLRSNRRLVKVKWAGMQPATSWPTLRPSFLGRLLKTYTVSVKNRNDGDAEIYVTSIYRGEAVAEAINDIRDQYLRENPT